jgi:hypothetical protein
MRQPKTSTHLPMADLCTCCDLPPESCGRAAEQRQRRDVRAQIERALDEPGVIRAKFLIGSCPGCRSVVPAGHPIRKARDGWVGVRCCGDGLDS